MTKKQDEDLLRRFVSEAEDPLSTRMAKQVASYIADAIRSGRSGDKWQEDIYKAIAKNPSLTSKEIGAKVIDIARKDPARSMSFEKSVAWIIAAIDELTPRETSYEQISLFDISYLGGNQNG